MSNDGTPEAKASRRDFLKGVSTPVVLSGDWVRDEDGGFWSDWFGDDDEVSDVEVYGGTSDEKENVYPDGKGLFFAYDEDAWYKQTEDEYEWKLSTIGGGGSSNWKVDTDGNLTPKDNEPISVERASITSLDSDELSITNTADITVNVPSDYATLQQAFDEVSKRQVPSGTVINVNIESGHEIGSLYLENGFWSHIRITSDDLVVPVDTSIVDDTTRIIEVLRGYAPQLATKIDAKGTGARGVSIGARSSAPKLTNSADGEPKAGVINVNGEGLRPGSGSLVSVENGDFSGCNIGLSTFNSVALVVGTDLSGASDKGILSNASLIRADSVNASGATNQGIHARNASMINAKGATLTNCGTGLRAEQASNVGATAIDASGAAGDGVVVAYASTVDLDGATIQNAGDRNLNVGVGSRANARNATLDGATNNDVRVATGSFISLHGATTTSGTPAVGDTNVSSFNSLSSDGVIFA